MSDSVAPKAAQNDEEISEQDSSERLKIASGTHASTHPPQADDDAWLDDLDTVPAPRGSDLPVEAEAAPMPPSEPIVPAPIVSIAAENPAPPASQPAERRRKPRKKKARRAVAAKQGSKQEPQRTEPVPAQVARPSEGFSAGPWLLLAAVAGVAGLWFLSRSGSEEALPRETPAVVTPQATEVLHPAAPVAPPIEPARIEQAAPPPAPEPEPAPEPKALAAKIETPAVESSGEPARIGAFKAVVEAGKSARTCRHRGDAAGKVPVIVEFGGDGRVQRTELKATFANPMTSRCIASRLGEATIPAFTGTPILITAEVSLR